MGFNKREKIYIPVAEYPEINFLGLLIGPKGITQKQMQDSTGAKILIRGRGASKEGGPSTTGHPDDNDELHVSIEGSEEAVEKATKEVRAILFNPAQAQRLKQEQLQRLAEMNGSSGGESHYGPSGGSSGQFQIELRVPNNMVGLIIGRGGENIVKIQTTLQVNCQIAKENEMKPGETLRSIIIKGSPEGVNEAKSRIDDIINTQLAKLNPQSASNNNNYQRELDHAFIVKLPVPNDKVGIIIGKGGMTIRGIQERTNSTIQIPAGPDDNDPTVRTLSIGADTKEATDSAQMEIFMALQMQQQSAAQAYNSSASALPMLVPDDRVGIIIGKGGATIKDIQNRHRVKVQIPQLADIGTNPPMRTISIVGPPEGQQAAKYEIEMVVAGGPNAVGGQRGGQSSDPYSAYGAYGAYGAQTSAYSGYYDPYSAAAAAAYPYGAYYGSTGYPTATTPTAATAGAAGAATATTAGDPASDPTAYYTAYWQYAVYYGEEAARQYYGLWSPPEGTPPPEGYVMPTPEQIAANTALANGAAAAETSASTAASGVDSSAAGAATTEASSAADQSNAAATDNAATATASADSAADPEVCSVQLHYTCCRGVNMIFFNCVTLRFREFCM